MANTTENKIDLTQWLNGEVYENYRGRGMFGKTCISFEYSSEHEAIADMMCALAYAEDEAHDLYEVLRHYRIDSMGLGVVLYFPNLAQK